MFSYFGSKKRLAKYYPRPLKALIIEPFAGSAQYALRYWYKDIIINDSDERIVKIWRYLQQCSTKDIDIFPHLKAGQKISTLHQQEKFPEGMLLLLKLLCSNGSVFYDTVSSWGERDYGRKLDFIKRNLPNIKHWQIACGPYQDLPNLQATWFVDPPYQVGGHRYTKSNKFIDYNELADWCKSRSGQTIVCESSQAKWLPFRPFRTQKGHAGVYREAIWVNSIGGEVRW